MNAHKTLLTACVLALAACASDAGQEGWQEPEVNTSDFEHEVYPVLLRDCAFNNSCHGSDQRLFRVWGPFRARLQPELFDPSAGQLQTEIVATRARAIGMIDGDDPKRSLLLRKPLATEAGGMGHLGADKWGRNLYRTTDSQGYVALSKWVFSVTQAP